MKKQSRRDWVKNAVNTGIGLSFSSHLLDSCLDTQLKKNGAKQPDMIYLNSNENPFGPSKNVIAAINKNIPKSYLYPNDEIKKLEILIAKKHKIPARNVIITAGSREALKAIGLTYGQYEGEVLTCSPTYEALIDYATLFKATIKNIPLKNNFQFDLDRLKTERSKSTKLIFICNPNNPTGLALNSSELTNFIKEVSVNTPIVIDEVYHEYIKNNNYPSAIRLIKKGMNVIVTRSFSKLHGLAGLRIGYMVAPDNLVMRLRKSLMANTNTLAVFAAKAALADQDFKNYSLKQNDAAKALIYNQLDKLDILYLKSHTNFVFFKLRENINTFRAKMLEQNIKVGREFAPMSDWCRVSTGTEEQMEKFNQALAKCY